MLADSACELAAARALTQKVAWEVREGADPKVAHARASMAKLHASEMAGRATDRAVQIFGGRGYLRDNPVERLWRDTRVDRIWEGTSEIQRLIIARGLAKRGVELLTR
jgi:acyl-CoA dehydrogenase